MNGACVITRMIRGNMSGPEEDGKTKWKVQDCVKEGMEAVWDGMRRMHWWKVEGSDPNLINRNDARIQKETRNSNRFYSFSSAISIPPNISYLFLFVVLMYIAPSFTDTLTDIDFSGSGMLSLFL